MGFKVWCGASLRWLIVVFAIGCSSGSNDPPANGTAGGTGAASAAGAGSSGAASAAASAADAGGGGTAQPVRDAAMVANAAVIVGSCLPDDGINRNALYLWNTENGPRFWYRLGRAAACLAQTKQGCGGVEECLGWRYSASSVECEWSCAGNVFSGCEDGVRAEIDCAKLGLSCDPLAICSDGPAMACDGEVFERSCTPEGLPSFCDDDTQFRGPSCERFGLACEAGYCVGTGAACSGEAPDYQGAVYFDGVACSGDELLACVGGREVRRDCASLAPGFGCQTVDGEPFCGLASECLPALDGGRYGSDPVRCEGSSVVFCNAGRVERIDCTALGFSGCDVEDGYGCVPGPAL